MTHLVSVKHSGDPREKYVQRKEENLPWIASPLKNGTEAEGGFSQREEASKIELFYDLFFVANLTTFTAVHEVNDRKSLSSYAGFFAIIWTTWLHVTLFDVRFAVDSIYERFCKVVQLMTMIGFASVGPEFDPNVYQNIKIFKTLTILLLLSRALLALQYLVTTVFVAKKRRETAAPLLFITMIFTITSAVYLGLFFTFNNSKGDKRYYLWYVLLAIETITVMGVSVRWRSLSFKKTHLPERLGLLTLIILGEGVIVLTKSVNYAVGADGWTWTSFGQVFVVVLTIYFLWALYFDRHPETHFGTIRQQIWCILHFPFHISLVLMLEGINNFILYHKALKQLLKFTSDIPDDSSPVSNALITSLNSTITSFKLADSKASDYLPKIYSALGNLTTSQTVGDQEDSISDLIVEVFTAVFKKYGFEAPEHVKVGAGQETIEPILSMVELIYKYFFVTSAFVILLLAVFMSFVRREKDIYDRISIGIRVVSALVMFLLTFISLNNTLMFHYLEGPWILPTVLLALLLILFVDKIVDTIALWRGRAKYGAAIKYSQPIGDHELQPPVKPGLTYTGPAYPQPQQAPVY